MEQNTYVGGINMNFWNAYEIEQKIIAESAAKKTHIDNAAKPPAVGTAPPDEVNAEPAPPEIIKEVE